MRNIEKRKEPESLRAYRSTPDADWDGYRGKQEAFAALCHEQGYLCAYCMRRIKPDQKPRKIEHWIARSHSIESVHDPSVHKDHQLKWSNLLGVCPGSYRPKPSPRRSSATKKQSTRPVEHCDSHRGNKPLAIHPATETRLLGTLFKYRNNGEICSDDPGAARDITTLNLNIWRLKENRKGVLNRLKKTLPGDPRHWTVSRLRNELARWQQRTATIHCKDAASARQTAQGFREYNQVAIHFLEKQLKKRYG